MKLNRKTVILGLLATLLLAASGTYALTLGRVRGAAILGKPLDIAVAIQSSPEEEVATSCLDATVYYGDNPIERSRVNISVQAGPQANTQSVRIFSDASVDEPVVRLSLRTLCNTKTSRNYTLLSDIVSEVVQDGKEPVALPSPAGAEGVNASVPAAIPGKAAVVVSNQPAKPVERPTLKLGPVVSAPTHTGSSPPTHKAASAKASALEDLQRRVDELAKLQANSVNLEDAQKSEARVKALEATIQGLRAITAKNQQSIQLVTAALESSSSHGQASAIAYGMGALLLICLAALAYLATRKGAGAVTTEPWWSEQQERLRAKGPGSLAAASAAATAAMATSRPSPLQRDTAAPSTANKDAPAPAGRSAMSDALGADGDTPVTPLSGAALANATAPKGRTGRPDFGHSASAHLKSINTREMLDVRQQAEFFMALGQHDEAVRLLESNIKDSSEYNPLVFLDLLKIFHTLGRRTEYESYRSEFNTQFTGRVPDYNSFLAEGNGLDAYEDICEQIVVLWPSEYTVDFIEQCLVRLPEDDPEQGLDLEAFKDLLLLYGVLKRLDESYDSNLAPFSTSRSDPSPGASIKPVLGGSVNTAPLPVDASRPRGASNIATGVDLDLDLNLEAATDAPKQMEPDNLIDFDVSVYAVPKNPSRPS